MRTKFFRELEEKLEEIFTKGEICECGKRLPCRSKALTFNAYANMYFDKHNEEERERIIKIINDIDINNIPDDSKIYLKKDILNKIKNK